MIKASNLSFWTLVLCSSLLLFACSDDDDPAGPTGDTAAPTVQAVSPSPDGTNVGVDQAIVVTFSEPMDPASATGNVTISAGTVTSVDWTDSRNLSVSHSPWAQGVNVEATVGAALADTAGNTLGGDFTWDFWTETAAPAVLEASVPDGATGVNRNVAITFLFSESMNLFSLNSATTVNSVTKASIPFQWFDGEETAAVLRFDETLPAETLIDVDIAASAQTIQGTPLGQSFAFSFTTGTDADTDPPNLVSVVPANGSTISPNTSQIVMTFDEPIDPERFSPSRLGAQFEMWIASTESSILWSEDGTVLTVPLTTPMPDGLPIAVTFDTYYDMAGNQQTTPIDYRVDVTGAPDFFPFVDGRTEYWVEEWMFTPLEGPPESDFGEYVIRWEEQPGGEFDRSSYPNIGFQAREDWETYERFSDRVEFLGFSESEGQTAVFVPFTMPVLYARLPFAVQSWTRTTQATAPDGTFDVDYTMSYVGQEDLRADVFGPIKLGEPPVEAGGFWIDAFKAVLEYELSDPESGSVFTTGADTLWFAPTVGLVRSSSLEVEPEVGTSNSIANFFGFYEPEPFR